MSSSRAEQSSADRLRCAVSAVLSRAVLRAPTPSIPSHLGILHCSLQSDSAYIEIEEEREHREERRQCEVPAASVACVAAGPHVVPYRTIRPRSPLCFCHLFVLSTLLSSRYSSRIFVAFCFRSYVQSVLIDSHALCTVLTLSVTFCT